MPQIIIKSNAKDQHEGTVVYQENVQPEHLESEHHAAQLIERVGWAVTDATEVETAAASTPQR